MKNKMAIRKVWDLVNLNCSGYMVTWCACRPTAMVTTVHNCLRKGLAEQKWEGTLDVLSWKKSA